MKSFGHAGLANRRVRDQAKSPEAAGLHDGGGLSKVEQSCIFPFGRNHLWLSSPVAHWGRAVITTESIDVLSKACCAYSLCTEDSMNLPFIALLTDSGGAPSEVPHHLLSHRQAGQGALQ